MFVGIVAERIEVSIADPEQQESILRFIQAEPGQALAVSERPKVEVEIRTKLAFRGLLALFHRRRQEVEAHSVVQPGERADLGPDLGGRLRVDRGPKRDGDQRGKDDPAHVYLTAGVLEPPSSYYLAVLITAH